jgi:hypothetical protein
MRLDASHGPTRRRVEQRRNAAYQAIREQFKAAGMDCIEISTAASSADALARYFRLREMRRR